MVSTSISPAISSPSPPTSPAPPTAAAPAITTRWARFRSLATSRTRRWIRRSPRRNICVARIPTMAARCGWQASTTVRRDKASAAAWNTSIISARPGPRRPPSKATPIGEAFRSWVGNSMAGPARVPSAHTVFTRSDQVRPQPQPRPTHCSLRGRAPLFRITRPPLSRSRPCLARSRSAASQALRMSCT